MRKKEEDKKDIGQAEAYCGEREGERHTHTERERESRFQASHLPAEGVWVFDTKDV